MIITYFIRIMIDSPTFTGVVLTLTVNGKRNAPYTENNFAPYRDKKMA